MVSFPERIFQPIDWTLTDITTPRQSGTGSNDNEEILHTSKIFKTGNSVLGAV